MISKSRARTLSLPVLAIAGVAMFCFTETKAKADSWDKKTILTIDQPVQVRNTYLQPGTYVFKLLDSQSDRHVVQIFNSDQSRIIDTVMAIPNYRLKPTGDSRFAFWETPPGKAKAMRAWFYPGDNFGQEFPYPKQLRELEVAAVVTHTQTMPTPPAVEEQPATVAEAPASEPAPVTTAAPPVEDAASNSPEPAAVANEPVAEAPAPAAEAPAPVEAAQEPAPASNELPKTASPYPLMGLAGLVSLGTLTALRRKHNS